ncbi:T1SS secreted agglutinin RTX [Psychrobacter sp. JB385]|nr:T1SS secreted agglutinin RTX [Psychrobacter sp. JB385]
MSVTVGNDDGFINAAEVDVDGNVDVIVGLPDNAVAGDTVIVNGVEQGVTPDDIVNGTVTVKVPAPVNGDVLEVTATITDAAGNVSGALTDTAGVVDIIAPNAPTIDTPIAIDDIVNDAEATAGFTVTGTGIDGDTITLSNAAGGVIGTATVIGGTWSIAVDQADVDAMGEGSEALSATATDPAGNTGPAATVTITIDTVAPDAPVVDIAEAAGGVNADEFVDGVQTQVTIPTGTLAGDTITLTVTPTDGGDVTNTTYEVTDADIISGVAEVTIPNGMDGVSMNGNYSVVATVTDSAGNVSAPSNVANFDLNTTFDARDDSDTLDLGELQETTYDPVTGSGLVILGALEGSDGIESGLGFTVNEGTSGTVTIGVQQTALVQVADAISLEIYDDQGNLLYIAANENNPLVGNVLGLEVLGLTNNAGGLTATISGLEPGDYTIVVSKDDSLLTELVNGLTLAELGEAGVVLGPENQDLILDAVGDALGPLGDLVVGLLEPILTPLLSLPDGLGLEELEDTLEGLDLGLGVGLTVTQIDQILDNVVAPLLSNILTLLETTDITATVTEFDYANNTVITGNVIDPNPGAEGEDGEDTVTPDTTVTDIGSNSNQVEPTSETVDGITVFTIQGQYGVLIIDENGDYTYTANGDFASLGQSETFTYTVSDGITSDTAQLVINIDATTPPVDAVDDLGTAEIVVTPITTTETLSNSATSVLSLLGAGNIQTAVDFNIAENSTGSAIIDISATGAVDVLNSSSLALQVRDASGTFVNVGNSNTNTGLIDVLGLFGTNARYEISDLPAGEYRLIGYVNPAVGVITTGTITATVTETDLSSVASIDTLAAEGNVIDENDAATSDTIVTSVEFDGQSFSIDGTTSIIGDHGTLIIDATGAYTYTPNSSLVEIGQTDVFTYTIVDTVTNSTDSATLTVGIESDYPAVNFPIDAVDDVATTELIVNPLVTTQTISLYDDVAIAGTAEVSQQFTITGDSGSAVFSVASSALLGGTDLIVEVQAGAFWLEVADQADAGVLELGSLLGDRLVLTLDNLDPGNYRVITRASGVGASVTLNGSVTSVDSDVAGTYGSQAAVGNVISENDDVTLSTVVSSVDGTNVIGATVIDGLYGTLTIKPDGSYFYQPDPDTNVINQVETFEYTILDGFNNTDTATLTINITSDWPAPAPVTADSMPFDDGFIFADDSSDDTIELPDTSLTLSDEGLDVLSFEGADQVISLADLIQPETLDIIDISGLGANTLNVAAEDMSSTLYIKGDSDDTVDLGGAGDDLSDTDGAGNPSSWIDTGVDVTDTGGHAYNVWQLDNDISTQMYIDTNITNVI